MSDPAHGELREREIKAAEVLATHYIMVSRPGEGHPQSDVFDCWGVCVGSHGGYGKTLADAMRQCLRCCGIGKWWQVSPEDPGLLIDLFRRVAEENKLGAINGSAREFPSDPRRIGR